MKTAVLHGRVHRRAADAMTHTVLRNLAGEGDTARAFFLPKDGPGVCRGCNSCSIRGEASLCR